MKQLDTQFVLDNNRFIQVKRGKTAAIFKRETLEGNLISFEVFAIKAKDGAEVYPNQTAAGKWLWTPIKETRAEKYFDGIENGDTAIPDVDPITGEYNRSAEDDKSLDEIGEVGEVVENVVVEDNTQVVVAVDDPTVPNSPVVAIIDSPVEVVETPVAVVPEVTPTADGGAIVQVAKVKKVKAVTQVQMVIPQGEFTQAQFAVANGLPVRGVVWGKLDALVKAGKLSKTLKQLGKGRPSQIFNAV